ncbi:hypothetical protein MP11Mi_07610 [Gordonia sp. MP11Mi]|uniref:Uncharacterized protein n=1 Tax=Gordonia sp. MP11Mi TaxID=3022769 RepID=A0AA97CST7_9ACTN
MILAIIQARSSSIDPMLTIVVFTSAVYLVYVAVGHVIESRSISGDGGPK